MYVGKSIDLCGKRFGRLLVVEKTSKRDHAGGIMWLCKCKCGNYTYVSSHSLKTGHCKSCGCYKIDVNRNQASTLFTKHGMRYTRLYNIWCSMKRRCFSPIASCYKNYGGRGITMCEEWNNDFMNFYTWAIENGYQDKLTIDRIDVNGNYCPENCRWLTWSEQANNKTNNHFVVYNNKRMTIKQLSVETGVKYSLLRSRIYKGWNIYDAINKPPRKSVRHENHIK